MIPSDISILIDGFLVQLSSGRLLPAAYITHRKSLSWKCSLGVMEYQDSMEEQKERLVVGVRGDEGHQDNMTC